MAAPIAAVAIRYIVIRGGVAVTRKIVTTVGKKTAARRMQSEAAKRGGQAFAPAPQGPYGRVLTQSRGGQHTSHSRMARSQARKSMRGPSAQKKRKKMTKRQKSDFKRYLRRHEDEEYMRYYDALQRY